MAVYQSLTLTEVEGSSSTATNTSSVRIVWKSTQTNDSRNDYTRTAKYWISINDGEETEHSVSYTLPKGTTKTILDTTITITHKADGSGKVKVRTWMDTSISAGVIQLSKELTLSTIPRASVIDSASGVTIGNACSVRWTPKSTAFRYKLKFALGNWSYTTGAIHPNKTSAYTYDLYTIPLDVANQVTNAKTGTMTVTLYTYSNSEATTQVGSADSETFTVTIPENEAKPTVSFTLSPVSTLGESFDGLYIQGKTGLTASLSIDTEYNATVSYSSITVAGREYREPYTVGYLTQVGDLSVKGLVRDSRGYEGTTNETITVIPYSKPKILDVIVARCNADGIDSDSGNYLRIFAVREYSKVEHSGTQKNFCQIRYRYKTENADSYSNWVTILERESINDYVNTDPLLGGTFSNQTTYMVQVQAIDDIGDESTTTVTIPTEKVYWHRDGVRRSFTFGGYVEEDDTFSIADGITFKVKGEKWIPIEYYSDTGVQLPTTDFGRCPNSEHIWYRIVNGNHVYVAFNLRGTSVGCVPEEIRPAKTIYSLCVATNGTVPGVACVSIDSSGGIWVSGIDGKDVTNISGIDGYIDYFI